MKLKAFSLIELLVVVAIIAVLAAVAVPVYSQYKVRTTIAGVVSLLQTIGESAQAIYQKTGTYPATVNFGSYSGLRNWGLINQGNIASGYYTIGVDGKGIILGATILNLSGIGSGYTSPSTTVAGSGTQADGAVGQNTLFIALRDVNGVIKMNCGAWNVSSYPSQSPPSGFRPSNCQCTVISTYADNGTLNTGCS